MADFTIREHDDCWSFETADHGLHKGYPDALQATAAAMRAFDTSLPREDVSVGDVQKEFAAERRASIRLVAGNHSPETNLSGGKDA